MIVVQPSLLIGITDSNMLVDRLHLAEQSGPCLTDWIGSSVNWQLRDGKLCAIFSGEFFLLSSHEVCFIFIPRAVPGAVDNYPLAPYSRAVRPKIQYTSNEHLKKPACTPAILTAIFFPLFT